MIALLPLLLMASPPHEPQIDCSSDALPQQHMNWCAGQELQEADAALNAQWKLTREVMKSRDADFPPEDGRPGYFETLLQAQRSWIAYRDGQCASEGFLFRGGSMEPLMVASCKTRLTKLRTVELRELESAE